MNARLVVLGVSALAAAGGCLPEPEPKAEIRASVRGSVGPNGKAEFVTSDGYVLRFDKRLAVIAIATTSFEGSGRYGGGSVRNLDVGPFDLKSIRGLGDQFIGAYTISYYRSQPSGPNVTPEDLDLLDGDVAGYGSRTNVAAFVFRGTLEKDGRFWRFDWRASLVGPSTCGRPTTDGDPAPVFLESESLHSLEIVMHTERLFGTAADPAILEADRFVKGDANGDGFISTPEAALIRSGEVFELGSWVFDLALDGQRLQCASLGSRGPGVRPPY